MYRYNYTNPLTKQYQAEYAMYEAIAKLFAGVSCSSLLLEQLKLYHAELSEKAKEDLEKEITYLVGKYVTDKVCFPAMSICRAEVKIRNKADGTHCFTFTDGVYSFSVSLKVPRRGRCRQIMAEDRKISGPAPAKKSNAKPQKAQNCA